MGREREGERGESGEEEEGEEEGEEVVEEKMNCEQLMKKLKKLEVYTYICIQWSL